jgi:hypothetical protein
MSQFYVRIAYAQQVMELNAKAFVLLTAITRRALNEHQIDSSPCQKISLKPT